MALMLNPELRIGQNWFVKLPGDIHLVEANITKVGNLVVSIRWADQYSHSRTYMIQDLSFVELVDNDDGL